LTQAIAQPSPGAKSDSAKRAVDITQIAAIAMSAGMQVNDLHS
jgi:hypothetical protein